MKDDLEDHQTGCKRQLTIGGPGREKWSDHPALRAGPPPSACGPAEIDPPQRVRARGCGHPRARPRIIVGPPSAACRTPPERVRARRDRPAPEGACTGVLPPAGPAAANCRTTQRCVQDPARARAGQPRLIPLRGCVHGGVATCWPDRCISGRGPRPDILGNLAWSAWTHRFGPLLWSLACPCSSVWPAQIVSGVLYPVSV